MWLREVERDSHETMSILKEETAVSVSCLTFSTHLSLWCHTQLRQQNAATEEILRPSLAWPLVTAHENQMFTFVIVAVGSGYSS